MPGNFKKEDLRIIKSYNALITALPKLLKRRNFRRLTVNDLCNESKLSRTAFYTHFRDKYDLLEYWLKGIKTKLVGKGYVYRVLEADVNEFIREHKQVLKNLLEDADSETLDLMYDFAVAVIDFPEEKPPGKPWERYVIMTNFCAGGIINWLLWQIKHNFPPEIQMMNPDLYGILNTLLQKETDGVGVE